MGRSSEVGSRSGEERMGDAETRIYDSDNERHDRLFRPDAAFWWWLTNPGQNVASGSETSHRMCAKI